jgi:hypothetical protein
VLSNLETALNDETARHVPPNPQAPQYLLAYSAGIAFATIRDFGEVFRDNLLHALRLALILKVSANFVEGFDNESCRLRIGGSVKDLIGLL